MKKWRTITKIAIPIVVALAIVYDVIALMRGGVEATISRVTLGWARENPIVPFAVGVLCGHLFWKQTPELDKSAPKEP